MVSFHASVIFMKIHVRNNTPMKFIPCACVKCFPINKFSWGLDLFHVVFMLQDFRAIFIELNSSHETLFRQFHGNLHFVYNS